MTAGLNSIAARNLLRADPELIRGWIAGRPGRLIAFCVAAIVVGAGSYGAAMGSWRSPLQGLYTGVKLPLVMLLTTIGNGVLNGMLAPLLGFNIRFRDSLIVVLLSFTITSIVLGALAPIALFLVWNTPPVSSATALTSPEYSFMQLTLAVFIAFAGIIGNVRLLPLLRSWSGNRGIGSRVLLAWLTCNLFLGSQVSWVLRPFIWDPAGPEFIGSEYLRGSFFETVFDAIRRLLFDT